MKAHFPKSVPACRPSKKDKHSQEQQKGSSSSTDDSVISESEEEDYGLSSEISSSESEEEIVDLSSNSSVCKDSISPSRSGHWKRKIGEGQAVKNLSCRKGYDTLLVMVGVGRSSARDGMAKRSLCFVCFNQYLDTTIAQFLSSLKLKVVKRSVYNDGLSFNIS